MILAYLKQTTTTYLCILGLVLISGFCSYAVAYDPSEAANHCQPEPRRLSQYTVRRAPRQVLLVPLLYKNPEVPRENERWPEPSAQILNNFYRYHYHAQVIWLRNIRTWQDYYQQTSELIQRGYQFDRIIFIAHGGFDGPLLRSEILIEENELKGDQAIAQQVSEAQPGNEKVISITYSLHKNKAFSDYLTNNWRELLNTPDGEMRHAIKQKHIELQAMDTACFDKFCNMQKLLGQSDSERAVRLESCERVCRPALYEVKNFERASEDRFMLFANSLRSLTREDGLIFMGECNAGTPTPKQYSHWDTPGIVVSSKIADGPYQNYVHLLSSASDRLVAGPIGKSSASDIVKRIISMEKNHEQSFLCMALPSQKQIAQDNLVDHSPTHAP